MFPLVYGYFRLWPIFLHFNCIEIEVRKYVVKRKIVFNFMNVKANRAVKHRFK